jgi:hypothetical protein
MVEMYVRLVKESPDWTIDRVPEKYREQVRTIIEEENANG